VVWPACGWLGTLHYYKGECMLDALSVGEFYAQGGKLNWCKLFMNKMLQVCANMHEKGGYFIFGYL
jgi:hypothetical protein